MWRPFNKGFQLVWLFLLAIVTTASAHEYWLAADQAQVAVGGETAVRLMFGKDFSAGEEKALQLKRTTRFQVSGQTRKPVDLLANGTEEQKPTAVVRAKKGGAILVAMDRSAAKIVFSRKKFVSYAESEGHVFAPGELPETGKGVHEEYTRYLKTLVRVGNPLKRTTGKVVGQAYEIVPVGDPFAEDSAAVTFKVLADGKPCAGAKVTAVHRASGRLTSSSAVTDKKGRCTFPISHDGQWLIRSVKIEAAPPVEATAQYRSRWASLTFGYE